MGIYFGTPALTPRIRELADALIAGHQAEPTSDLREAFLRAVAILSHRRGIDVEEVEEDARRHFRQVVEELGLELPPEQLTFLSAEQRTEYQRALSEAHAAMQRVLVAMQPIMADTERPRSEIDRVDLSLMDLPPETMRLRNLAIRASTCAQFLSWAMRGAAGDEVAWMLLLGNHDLQREYQEQELVHETEPANDEIDDQRAFEQAQKRAEAELRESPRWPAELDAPEARRCEPGKTVVLECLLSDTQVESEKLQASVRPGMRLGVRLQERGGRREPDPIPVLPTTGARFGSFPYAYERVIRRMLASGAKLELRVVQIGLHGSQRVFKCLLLLIHDEAPTTPRLATVNALGGDRPGP